MQTLKRFLLITIMPMLMTLLYKDVQAWVNSISARTYMLYPKYLVMYTGNILLGIMLFLLIDRTRKRLHGDGWSYFTALLLNLFSVAWIWRPFWHDVRLPLPGWFFNLEPYSAIMVAIYSCLLIRWWKGG